MKLLKKLNFTLFELILWVASVAAILLSFFLYGNKDLFYLAASLLGATMLVFVSKGNVIGQILTVIFSIVYGIISFSFRYYGEMITYLGMTMPIAIASVITWLKNPFWGKKSEVAVNSLTGKEYLLILLAGTAVTVAFYFILKALNTANLLFSTLSVFTSFVAVWLTMRRSPLYAVGYALNDVVLIVLWSLAAVENKEYLSMVVCFAVFLVNDIYGFFNWLRMKKRQAATEAQK